MFSELASKKCLACDAVNLQPNLLCSTCYSTLNFITYNAQDKYHAIFLYRDLIKILLLDYKQNDQLHLLGFLASQIIAYSKEYNLQFEYVAALPISRKKLFKRGFNQSAALAKRVAKLTGKKFLFDLLYSSNAVEQKILRKKQRQKNLVGKFTLNKKYQHSGIFQDKNILLIDDIITTGSTFSEALKQLEGIGAKKIIPLAIAHPVIY